MSINTSVVASLACDLAAVKQRIEALHSRMQIILAHEKAWAESPIPARIPGMHIDPGDPSNPVVAVVGPDGNITVKSRPSAAVFLRGWIAEQTARLCEDALKSEFSPWFPGTIKPVRAGVYQTGGHTDGIRYDGKPATRYWRKWHGEDWGMFCYSQEAAEMDTDSRSGDRGVPNYWRGLAE